LERRLSMKNYKDIGYEDLAKICQGDKTLTDDEEKREVAVIEARRESRQKERVSRQKEFGDLQKRTDQIVERRHSISREISALGEKVTKMLARDIDPGELLESERKLVEEDKLLARTSAGLQTRLTDSKQEMDLLEAEESEDEFLLKIFRVVHFPDLLNTNGIERSKLIEGLTAALDDLNCSLYPGSGGLKPVSVSDFNSIETIPQFFLCGDGGLEDRVSGGGLRNLWSLREFNYSRQKAREKIE
jgi:hypothetical protein